MGDCRAPAQRKQSLRYVMKKKLFSLGDKFGIRNQRGEEVFFVNAEVFALGNKLSFEDPESNRLLYISQKLLAWGPTYELYRGVQHVATIKKELFTFLQCAFEIHTDDQGDAWEADALITQPSQTSGYRPNGRTSLEVRMRALQALETILPPGNAAVVLGIMTARTVTDSPRSVVRKMKSQLRSRMPVHRWASCLNGIT
jgi:uncharacterized protein YxjI